MRRLVPLHRRILKLQLQGNSLEEIVAEAQRGVSTVRRVLERVKEQLGQYRCLGSDS